MRKLFILTLALLAFTSCRNKDLIRPGDTLEIAYEKAMNVYNQEEYAEAARAFETVVSIGRGTDIGQDAQFYLAESYFKSGNFLVSASEYERYALFFPNSPRRIDAEFKTALSYYHLSPRYKLDQSYTEQAIERFRLFTSRYPSSERVTEAGDYIAELRNKLAQKKYSGSEFYMRTRRYLAAITYNELLIDRYPETKWAERALVNNIEAYILYADNSVPARQAERYQKAIDTYETYMQVFPRGENRSRAESLYDRAKVALDRVSTNNDSTASSE